MSPVVSCILVVVSHPSSIDVFVSTNDIYSNTSDIKLFYDVYRYTVYSIYKYIYYVYIEICAISHHFPPSLVTSRGAGPSTATRLPGSRRPSNAWASAPRWTPTTPRARQQRRAPRRCCDWRSSCCSCWRRASGLNRCALVKIYGRFIWKMADL